MTKDEWIYLYSGRPNASSLKTTATVIGKKGMIFLPDNWNLPNDVSLILDAADATLNTYTATVWKKMEEAGAVFLPITGTRYLNTLIISPECGNYWSSTNYGNGMAYSFNFDTEKGTAGEIRNGRFYGCGVRLVHEKLI